MNTKTGERPQAVQGHYDWGLLTVVTLLLLLGLVMVFSASYPRGLEGFDNPYYFVARQFIWLLVGAVGLVIAARIPYLLWNRWSVPIMGAKAHAFAMQEPDSSPSAC
ncbi:MAG: FtsW/RodA/SpoVE family cell cycle protein [Caldilinea sp.]|nr:FtsW/RodA/SpoVE family cell cycle protein [Caldilinea sp.]